MKLEIVFPLHFSGSMSRWGRFSNNFCNVSHQTASFLRRCKREAFLPPKAVYFAVSAVYHALYMFRAKFITGYMRLSVSQYGDIMAIMALVSFAFMALWGTCADLLGRHRSVLAFLCLALAASTELCLFVQPIKSQMVRYVLTAAIMSLYSFFACGLLPLADYLTLRRLEDIPGFSRDMYGRQRLWGTISYGITTYLIGKTIRWTSLAAFFVILPILSGGCTVVLFTLAPSDRPKPIRDIFRRHSKGKEGMEKEMANDTDKEKIEMEKLNKEQSDPKKTPTDQRRPIIRLLTNPNYLFMLLAVFLTGCARTVMTTFLAQYLNDQKLDPDQIGISANFGVVVEIVIFFFGPKCIEVFGTCWMLVLAQLAMALRCWAYESLSIGPSTVWLVYGIELLKGVGFGFTQLAGVKLASDVAPKGLEATAQALYTSVYSQLPAVITAFGGGRIYERMGAHALFLITAIVMTVALVLFTIKYTIDGSIRFPWQSRRNS